MMRNRLMAAAALSLMMSAHVAAQCPGAPYAQMYPGGRAYITTIGDTLNLRAEPNVNSEVLEELPAGMAFTFADDPPFCNEGFIWYRIEAGTRTGWIAEGDRVAYFIAPLYEQPFEGTISGERAALRYSTSIAQRVVEGQASTDLVFQSDDGRGGWQTRGSVSFYSLVESDTDAPDPRALDALRAVLETRPTEPTNLPALINPDAVPPRALTANTRYLTFSDGEGVRYIAAFANDDTPILGDGLRYIFHGITADSRYVLAATFPIVTNALPLRATFDAAAFAPENYTAYLDETRATIDRLSMAQFTPDLALLDMLLASIVIG